MKTISNPGVQKDGHFTGLDSLRGICALFVALFHTTWASHLKLLPFAASGWLFVDFFFILSGFVISHAYLQKIGTVFELGRFMLRRFFRLYPLHIFTYLAAFSVAYLAFHLAPAHQADVSPMAMLMTADMGQALLLAHGLGFASPTFNAPSWSISTEFWTYLVFAISLLLLRPVPRGRFAIFALLMAFLCAGYFIAEGELQNVYRLGFPRCLSEFMFGVLTYLAYSELRRFSPSSGLAVCMQVIAVLSGLAIMLLSPPFSRWNMLVIPVFMLVILATTLDQKSFLKSALESTFARFLGDRSYSIYMAHSIVLTAVSFSVTRLVPLIKASANSPAQGSLDHLALTIGDMFCLAYLAAIVAVSWATFRFVEKPGQHIGLRLSNRVFGKA